MSNSQSFGTKRSPLTSEQFDDDACTPMPKQVAKPNHPFSRQDSFDLSTSNCSDHRFNSQEVKNILRTHLLTRKRQAEKDSKPLDNEAHQFTNLSKTGSPLNYSSLDSHKPSISASHILSGSSFGSSYPDSPYSTGSISQQSSFDSYPLPSVEHKSFASDFSHPITGNRIFQGFKEDQQSVKARRIQWHKLHPKNVSIGAFNNFSDSGFSSLGLYSKQTFQNHSLLLPNDSMIFTTGVKSFDETLKSHCQTHTLIGSSIPIQIPKPISASADNVDLSEKNMQAFSQHITSHRNDEQISLDYIFNSLIGPQICDVLLKFISLPRSQQYENQNMNISFELSSFLINLICPDFSIIRLDSVKRPLNELIVKSKSYNESDYLNWDKMNQELTRHLIRYVYTRKSFSPFQFFPHCLLIRFLGLSAFSTLAFARILRSEDLRFIVSMLKNAQKKYEVYRERNQLDSTNINNPKSHLQTLHSHISELSDVTKIFKTTISFHPMTVLHECPHVTESIKIIPVDKVEDSHHENVSRLLSVLVHLATTNLNVPQTFREVYINELISRSNKVLPLRWLCMVNNLELKLNNQACESPKTIWDYLNAPVKLLDACALILDAPISELEELALFHTPEHLIKYCKSTKDILYLKECFGLRIQNLTDYPGNEATRLMNCGVMGLDTETFWNQDWTVLAARSAVGQVINLAQMVCTKQIPNGMALIRPPGHHAEMNHEMGFCYLNSVAIAALAMIKRKLAKRILIVDWDIHHGNGTSQVLKFCDPGQILYCSIHRHDQGTFYPGTGDSIETNRYLLNIAWDSSPLSNLVSKDPIRESLVTSSPASERRNHWKKSKSSRIPVEINETVKLTMTDSNINLHEHLIKLLSQSKYSDTLLSHTKCQDRHRPSDAEYISAIRSIVMPVAREYQPDLVLVSAGFDAAYGHSDNMGGYDLSPGLFAWITRQLMTLANGSIVLALEGGYNEQSLSESIASCINALLIPPPLIIGDESDELVDTLLQLDDLRTACYHLSRDELLRLPSTSAVCTLQSVRDKYSPSMTGGSSGWSSLAKVDIKLISSPHLTTEKVAKLFSQANRTERLSESMARLRVEHQ